MNILIAKHHHALICISVRSGVRYPNSHQVANIAQDYFLCRSIIIPKHLHEPRFDEEVEFLTARLGVLLQLANLVQLPSNPLLLGEWRKRNL